MMKHLFAFILTLAIFTGCQDSAEQADETTRTDSAGAPVETAVPGNASPALDSTATSGQSIVPGKQIGRIVLGMPADSLQPLLGKPDRSDAAMGKAWLSWYNAKRDERNNRISLDVFTAYADSTMKKKNVQQVRTTSTEYSTSTGLKVYDDLATIQQKHPGVAFGGKYKELNSDRVFSLYDDLNSGIAFEIVEANQQTICIGIIVHYPGKTIIEISPLLSGK